MSGRNREGLGPAGKRSPGFFLLSHQAVSTSQRRDPCILPTPHTASFCCLWLLGGGTCDTSWSKAGGSHLGFLSGSSASGVRMGPPLLVKQQSSKVRESPRKENLCPGPCCFRSFPLNVSVPFLRGPPFRDFGFSDYWAGKAEVAVSRVPGTGPRAAPTAPWWPSTSLPPSVLCILSGTQ